MAGFKQFGPAIIWAFGIMLATLLPSSNFVEPPDWGLPLDKLTHFLLFGILAILILKGINSKHASRLKKNLLPVVTFCILYGLLLETGQIYVPGRNFSWADIIANSTGSALSAVGFWTFVKLKR